MNEVAEKQEVNIIPAQDPERFIQMAIEKGADVTALEKLMDLKERYDRQQAKKAFDAALSKFQSICPNLKRTKEVKYNNVNYSYAPLPSIREQIQEHLTACQLSYRWEIKDERIGEENAIRVRCIVTHIAGHSESTEFSAFADASGSKNDIQSRGSTVTYAQRYTLIGALGITSADTDDDGQATGGPVLQKVLAHVKTVREHFHTIYITKQSIADNQLDMAAEAMCELDKETRNILFLAPSKGGIFTTEERNVMCSKEFLEHVPANDPTEGTRWRKE